MERLDFQNDWPMPNEFLLELGRMTAMWPSLENTVNVSIGKLMGYSDLLDARVVIALAHSNFQQRVDILASLCDQLAADYPQLEKHSAVIKQIKSAQTGRNKYAHNGMSPDDDGKVSVAFASARGVLKTTVETVHLNDIKEVTAKIHEASCALHSMITNNHLAPIWEKRT